MGIRVYNTLSAMKEEFVPVRAGQVGIYCCGPTVYMPSHIGHMVGPVVFDTVKRYLSYCGYKVTLVINVTDIEDKLIRRAAELNKAVAELAAEVTEDYVANLDKLNVQTIDHMPKATEHIGEIIEITRGLVDRGYAYASGGDVYFDVTKDEDYGKLSHRDPEALQAGARIEPSERKRNPSDFALWKAAKPGEPSWPSPWGPGRPGWHIECSAMSMKYLGETFDIHGGGLDLVFPHHENELAQSESYTGKQFVRYWMHNGLLRRAGEAVKLGGPEQAVESRAEQEERKMSKSKGQIVTVTELLSRHQPETVRFFLLATHYRRPVEFGEERISEADRGLQGFYRFFERFARIAGQDFFSLPYSTRRRNGDPAKGEPTEFYAALRAQHERFIEWMDDDFNTGGAIGVLFDLLRTLNGFIDRYGLEDPARRDDKLLGALHDGTSLFREFAALLGLFLEPPRPLSEQRFDLSDKLIDILVQVRQMARQQKQYLLADEIRTRLKSLGIVLEDRRDGTVWRVERGS